MKTELHGHQILVRESRDADVPAIQAIYAHYVRTTCASFEEIAPDVAEMASRRAALLELRLPYLVAEADGEVRGFAYAARFRPRSAYRYTVEDSIYVAPMAVGRGIGRLLLETLIEHTTELGYRQMIAVIGDSANAASINLHRRAGFEQAGVIKASGFKLGTWVDAVFMQRSLGEGDTTLPGL